MAIIRSERRNRYTTISNAVFANNQLSFQAMGMLSYILSKPDNWSVSPAQLITVTKNTAKKTARDGVYAILKELKDTGFVGVEKLSTGDTNYIVYDTPIAVNPNTHNTDMVNPNPSKPDPSKPDPSKPTLIKTDLKQELNNNNKDLLSSKPDDVSKPDADDSIAKQVIKHLNAVTNNKYQACQSNIGPINARMAEGFTLQDLLLVIDHKFFEWGQDSKMAQYVRPSTLFSPSKFAGYLKSAQVAVERPNSRPVTAADFDDITWAQNLDLNDDF
ncbi:hypothetical protein GLP27_13565 [Photobacterium carnosum]|nr:hypothetical protein [Photobacterium carnosum]